MQLSQSEWSMWAIQRKADAPKIAKQYEVEAARVTRLINERGCTCDPTITYDPVLGGTPQVAHALDCTNNG